MFGELIRRNRNTKGLSMRKFCELINTDKGNWSKVERGMLGPPQDKEKLEKIAGILDIAVESVMESAVSSKKERGRSKQLHDATASPGGEADAKLKDSQTQDIALKTQTLPDTVEDLHKFILVSREMLQAHMAKLRAIDKVNLARSAHDAALADAQNLGEVVLRAEAKLGEILKTMELSQGGRPAKTGSPEGTSLQKAKPKSSRGKKLKEMGISKKQSHHAQALATHPHAIDQAIEQAKQKEEVPTRAAVLRVIHRETHPPKPREPQPKQSKNVSCPEVGIKSKEFSSAFRAFMIEIVKARDGGWQTTSKEAALHCLGSLECAINLKPQNVDENLGNSSKAEG